MMMLFISEDQVGQAVGLHKQVVLGLLFTSRFDKNASLYCGNRVIIQRLVVNSNSNCKCPHWEQIY